MLIKKIIYLKRLLIQIIKLILNRGFPKSEEYFNRIYNDKKWKFESEKGLTRYTVITGYIYYYKLGGCILDVGCGSGALINYLLENTYSKYIGIDISQVALNCARLKQKDNIVFIKTNISDYKPDEKFDVIIFNESIYYTNRPLKELGRYMHYLKNDGIFIVSIWDTYGTNIFWKNLTAQNKYNVINEVKLVLDNKTSHTYKVIKPQKY